MTIGLVHDDSQRDGFFVGGGGGVKLSMYQTLIKALQNHTYVFFGSCGFYEWLRKYGNSCIRFTYEITSDNSGLHLATTRPKCDCGNIVRLINTICLMPFAEYATTLVSLEHLSYKIEHVSIICSGSSVFRVLQQCNIFRITCDVSIFYQF